MSILLHVTEAVAVDILSSWLWERDVARLDAAMCTRKSREEWRKLLAAPELCWGWTARNDVFLWSLATHARFRACKFSLCRGFGQSEWESFIVQSAATLRSCQLSGNGRATGVGSIIKVAHNLEQLDIDRLVLSPEDVESICTLPRITDMCIRDSTMPVLGYTSEGLQFRTLVNVKLYSLDVGDEFMAMFAAATPSMLHVELDDCCELTDTTAFAIARHWPLLESVEVKKSRFSDAGAFAISEACSRLKAIFFYGPTRDPAFNRLTNDAITAFIQNCVHVEQMAFDAVRNVPVTTLYLVARQCPQLRLFSAYGVTEADDACIMALVDGCALLQQLGLPNSHFLTLASLQYIASQCKHLQELKFCLTPVLTKRNTQGVLPSHVLVTRELERYYDDDGNRVRAGQGQAASSGVAVVGALLSTGAGIISSAAGYAIGAMRGMVC